MSSANGAAATSSSVDASAATAPVSSKKRYRKDKPWDTDDIDHWAPVSVTPDTPLPAPLEESSFAVLFPRYREKYLREVWPILTSTLAHYGLSCQLDLVEGSMTVRTTRKTWDPSMILKARDVIKLLSRSLPVQQAVRVLEDEVYCDVVKIKNLVRAKERFVKRRQRLIGPNGCTLKAIELVTDCYVLVQGNTVSAIGGLKGIKAVRRIVEECMRNVHPIYHIKLLMMKRELAADPTLRDDNWDRFLPKFKKRNVQRKPTTERKERVVTLFPPAATPRKVDMQMETGEYWLSNEQKDDKVGRERAEKGQQQKERKRKEREAVYVPPVEQSRQRTVEADGAEAEAEDSQRSGAKRKAVNEVDSVMSGGELNVLKEKLRRGRSQRGEQKQDAAAFVIGGEAKKDDGLEAKTSKRKQRRKSEV